MLDLAFDCRDRNSPTARARRARLARRSAARRRCDGAV